MGRKIEVEETASHKLKFLPSNFCAPSHATRGGQVVFDWDRLENFLLTRNRPVGNEVTSTKGHKMQRFSCK